MNYVLLGFYAYIYIAINLIAAGRITQTELIDFQFFKTKKEVIEMAVMGL